MDRERVIEVAVNWWADKISKRHHHDNGDNSTASVMACLMADMGHKETTEEQVEVFKRELTALLTDEYENFFGKSEHGSILLGCNYGPSLILDKAAEIAGINILNFPFKTFMYIGKGEVKVSDGYCQPLVKIGE